MSSAATPYWQAKIWGLLHDPALKALHDNTGRGGEGVWSHLDLMQGWRSPKETQRAIADADLIASASDRSAIGSINCSVNYRPGEGLEITHLLSGAMLFWRIDGDEILAQQRAARLQECERSLLPDFISREINDPRKVLWWLWRCLPEAAVQHFGDNSLLMPAETRLPDGSIWSHASITAALAGAIEGYAGKRENSRPYLANFTFSPVQELIKASRKMRDFWAGSWILHYLSAKVCWKLANLYGPDALLYPSLFQQPLIDHWLLQQYPDFADWIKVPSDRHLLTAGFPNVIVLILPQERVEAAMQMAKATLKAEWLQIAQLVFEALQKRSWMKQLTANDKTWHSWLDSQWQTYWSAVPIGDRQLPLKDTQILRNAEVSPDEDPWVSQQNRAFQLDTPVARKQERYLFIQQELEFLRLSFGPQKPGVNVGSWWPAIFDQLRLSLNTIKNARNWQLPTAFGPRSTISGLGPVVYPDRAKQEKRSKSSPETSKSDWVTEGDTRKLWQREIGLFDGTEELNATETVKRGLEKVLGKLLNLEESDRASEDIAASYPDLTSGVAGYLHQNPNQRAYFQQVCNQLITEFPWAETIIHDMRGKWGIPLEDERPQKYHPRLLNAGWLVEDAPNSVLEEEQVQAKEPISKDQAKMKLRTHLQTAIDRHYPTRNPADWYVLAAGDGDGMSEWLKGEKMQFYYDYLPQALKDYANPEEVAKSDSDLRQAFSEFACKTKKRMGPATHSALSRALLDFSNQLVPYLTERRYAGRLIYSGGDDVLAYTNLWEWDRWLWDIRQCFRGDADPQNPRDFEHKGDYWQWENGKIPQDWDDRPLLSSRPLFTMGRYATISFGITIAHHSVPLAIALESLWEAEEEAKDHEYFSGCQLKKKKPCYAQKDAVQVRVIYGNGNILKATAKFDTFNLWRSLLDLQLPSGDLEPALFEQAAQLHKQHPIPQQAAIAPWTRAFCQRRDALQADQGGFQKALQDFLEALWITTPEGDRDDAIEKWLKLAAFVRRNRQIKIGSLVPA